MTKFAEAFPEIAAPESVPGRGNTTPRGDDLKRDKAYKDALRRVIKQGWTNATVVSLHRFPLNVGIGPMGFLTCPAKKQGEPYAKVVLDKPRFDAADRGDANYEFIPVMPKELADEMVRHYEQTGGVFSYEGDGPVPQDQLAEAVEAQLTWYRSLFEQAVAAWAEHKNPRHITGPMRDAAKELYSMKLISFQPDWINVSRAEAPDMPCEACGKVLPKIAKFCTELGCQTIFDPDWVKANRPDIWIKQHPNDVKDLASVLIEAPSRGPGRPPKAQV